LFVISPLAANRPSLSRPIRAFRADFIGFADHRQLDFRGVISSNPWSYQACKWRIRLLNLHITSETLAMRSSIIPILRIFDPTC